MVCWPSCRPVKFRLAFQRPSAPDRTEVATFVPGTCTRMLELGSAVPDTSTPSASTALITSSFATLPFTVVWRVTAGAPWIVTSSVVSVVLPALSVADTTSAALAVPLAGAGGMSAAGTVIFHCRPLRMGVTAMGLPFQVACSVLPVSEKPLNSTSPLARSSGVMIPASVRPMMLSLGGVLSTVNSWLVGADVVPPGAVAVAEMLYLPSGIPLMSTPSMIHLPWPSAVTD